MIMYLTNHTTQTKNHQVSGLEVNFYTHRELILGISGKGVCSHRIYYINNTRAPHKLGLFLVDIEQLT